MRNERVITVDKKKLVEVLTKNKEQHILDYKEALIAYKAEALRQLADLSTKATEGDTKLVLRLITPVDRSDWYDDQLSSLEWEVNTTVQISQDEFEELVLDKEDTIMHAKMLNSSYKH